MTGNNSIALLLGIGTAGFAGAVARYLLSGWAYNLFGGRLPYGTLAVNVIGSFALGIVYALSIERSVVSPEARLIISVGFLGALTTFSTFSLETFLLMSEGSLLLSLINIVMNLILSIAAVMLGMSICKILW